MQYRLPCTRGAQPAPVCRAVAQTSLYFACVPHSDRRLSGRSASCSASVADAGQMEAPNWRQALCASVLALSMVAGAPQPALAADDGTSQRAVTEYIDMESQGKFKNSKALEDFRQKYRLRRGADGRLQLRSSRGEWFQCRLDMEVPGSMLLRDGKGYIYAIQTDAIQQIDLSDDLVVLMMFSDGDWEKQMAPVEFADEKGATQQLQLQEKEFREVIGLLKEIQDLEEEGKGK